MKNADDTPKTALLLMVAGAKGAVASTVAVAAAALRKHPETVLPSLTTRDSFPYLSPPNRIYMAGWDNQTVELTRCIQNHGVLSENIWQPHQADFDETPILEVPSPDMDLKGQVDSLMHDIQTFRHQHPGARPVLVNLLPANIQMDLERFASLAELYAEFNPVDCPDLAYVLAAVLSGVPVVNFTPNRIATQAIISEAIRHKVPLCGCDGKTGQTYLKVALASALKARNLFVDGWYSLNILGNTDGKNLMDPQRACNKVANKTEFLDEILGYRVGQQYGCPSHKVHIDYYPPRGDAKEAWDVIDFKGMFGLPMSIRLNLQGRDSILAAPLVLDLARWMAVLQMAGRYGAIPELAFYFKKPLGNQPPLTFQEQILSLQTLEKECDEKCL